MIVDCIVVAAGSSERFGGTNKLYADLCGKPVLQWSLEAFAGCPSLGQVVLVARDSGDARVREIVAAATAETSMPVHVVDGGARRRDSVEAGLRACTTRYAAIHDGARPLATAELFERVVAGAEGSPGAIAARPVSDTIKEVAEGVIVRHPDRRRLWAAQTPQVVLRQAWLDAAAAGDDDETDDAAMLSRFGLECRVVEGERSNLKITTPEDLAVARALLAERLRR